MARHADLNMLTALDALLTECSVTRAAERLQISQPAMSSALARLRRHFGDDLLIRAGQSYQLTPLAARLAAAAADVVAAADQVLSAQPDFDPVQSRRTFTVIMSDYAVTVLGAAVAALIDQRAPHVRLHVQPTTRQNVDQAADELREVDLLVLPHGIVTGLPHHNLYQDEWACLVDAAADAELTVEDLAVRSWVLTYHDGTAITTGARELRTHGIDLDARLVVESYTVLPALIAGTDRVALIQRQLGAAMAESGRVRMVECPFPTAPVVEAMWWHPGHENDPAHRWLRRCFADAAIEVQQ
ncbi:LysR family transcriptional regulator [Actinoplanes derwentensis]|uniref:DNA-binding transcriptional regulator, LysR family n=1 Tax=Actinoplanes derwentensis TaxID=113562 RepID=A0A1H1XJG0_9ACTN|nr:LysR family transcriptional regulator [Actinoplanes derwentensis]GID87764.1 LysR family transcriptional regulator [Actinoplanes derwentensis]SDT09384.1 DNA-binding transcriptional regulator, LysR family [Actinoplanes derwentensis]